MIAERLLKCGSLDINFLERKIEEFDLDFDEVHEMASYCKNKDVNDYIYAAFMLAADKIKNKVIEHVKQNSDLESQLPGDWENKINDYEVRIHVNYLDSGFDNEAFEEFDISDPSADDCKKVIDEIF